jgi:hypothetical protein
MRRVLQVLLVLKELGLAGGSSVGVIVLFPGSGVKICIRILVLAERHCE